MTQLRRLAEEDDFPPQSKAGKFLAICFSPRSGSNLLSAEMRRTGRMGVPMEYFSYDSHMLEYAAAAGARSLGEYVVQLIRRRTSPNGVFSAKLLPGNWMMLKYSSSSYLIHDACMVVTFRLDIVAQTVSHVIAHQTGQWLMQRPGAAGDATYDYPALLKSLRFLEGLNVLWVQIARERQKPVFLAAYEEIAAQPRQVAQAVARTFDIELAPDAILPHIPAPLRQATDRNLEWAERFKADLARNNEALAPSVFIRKT